MQRRACLALVGVLALAAGSKAAGQAPAGKPFEKVAGTGYEGAIVPEERASELWKGAKGSEAEGYWAPKKADVTKLEKGLAAYVKQAAGETELGPGLAEDLPGYKRQYVGFLEGGKKKIFVSFVCDGVLEMMGLDWAAEPILVEDGGQCFFEVHFDVDSGQYEKLAVRGEA
jgi:hypothetical protein